MKASIAMRWRTSVSSEMWRWAPVANTATMASTITTIGANRRRRPGRALPSSGLADLWSILIAAKSYTRDPAPQKGSHRHLTLIRGHLAVA
jgi:hypothetical protein